MDIINTDSTRMYGTRMSGEEQKCVCIIEQILAQICFMCHSWCIYIRNCKNEHVSFSLCIHTSICNNLNTEQISLQFYVRILINVVNMIH